MEFWVELFLRVIKKKVKLDEVLVRKPSIYFNSVDSSSPLLKNERQTEM